MSFTKRVDEMVKLVKVTFMDEDDVELPDGTIEVKDVPPEVVVQMDEVSETAVIAVLGMESCRVVCSDSLKAFYKVLSLADSLSVVPNPDDTVNFAVTIE